MKRIKILNQLNGSNCDMEITDRGKFHLSLNGRHVDSYYLFAITPEGLVRDASVASDRSISIIPPICADGDNSTLLIIGVDEI